MRTIYKILLIIIVPLFLTVLSYLTFIYFFTKEPEPIEAYTFTMSYNELEKRIHKEIIDKSKFNNVVDTTFKTRYITLGKDSDKYFFITNLDKNKSKEYNSAWIELQAITDSCFKMIDVFYKNKGEYHDKIEIFEKDFVDKLKKHPAGASVPLLNVKRIK